MDDTWSPKHGRRSKGGMNSSELDDILGDLLKDDSKPTSEEGKPRLSGGKSRSEEKRKSLTSTSPDPVSDISDVDPEEVAKNIGEADDLDAELFGKTKSKSRSSSTPTNLKKPLEKKVTFTDLHSSNKTSKEDNASFTKTESSRSRSSTPKFGEFDENDPLAGLLSDEESEHKEKSKKEVQPLSGQKPVGDNVLEVKKGISSGSRRESRSKDLNFDDDDDVLDNMGLDDTPPKANVSSISKEANKKNTFDDILGEDVHREKPKRNVLDDLMGKRDTEKFKHRRTMLDEILGKTEEEFPKIVQSDKPLQGRRRSDQKEEVSKKELDDEFSFGSYMPSAVSQPSSGRRRSLRMAEDDVFKFSSESPLLNDSDTGIAKGNENKNADWLGLKEDSVAVSKTPIKNEQPKRNPSLDTETFRPSSGADWLGLKDSAAEPEQLATQSFTDWLGLKDNSKSKTSSDLKHKTDNDSDFLSANESGKKIQQIDWLGQRKESISLGKSEAEDTFQKSSAKESVIPRRRTSLVEEPTQSKLQESGTDASQENINNVYMHSQTSGDIPAIKPLISSPLLTPFPGSLASQTSSALTMMQSNLNRLNAAVSEKQQLLLHQEQVFKAQQEELLHQQEQQATLQLQLLQQQEAQLKNFQQKQKELMEQQLREQQEKQEMEMQRLQQLIVEQQQVLMQQQMQSTNQPLNIMDMNSIIQSPSLLPGSQLNLGIQTPLFKHQILNLQTDHQKVVLGSAEELLELRVKIRRLEIERDHLSLALETCRKRFQDEVDAAEISFQKKLKMIEETNLKKEIRWKEENELLISEHTAKLKSLELEKAELIASHFKKLEDINREHSQEMERIKEIHRKAIGELKKDHEETLVRLRKIKDQEIEAIQISQSHSRNIDAVVKQVHVTARHLEDLQVKVDAKHRVGLSDKEIFIKARDDQLKIAEEHFKRQHLEYEIERNRLQELLTKMEIHVREQVRQVDEERWNLKQEQNRLQQLQFNLEEEKKMFLEQVNKERQDLQKSKDALINEQKTSLKQLHEERQAWALERAQMEISHHLNNVTEQKQHASFKSLQVDIEAEATLKSLAIEKSRLNSRAQELRNEAEHLLTERLMLDQGQKKLELEKEKLAHLGLQVKQKSEEIEEMHQAIIRYHEEGESALMEAKTLQNENDMKLQKIQNQLQFLGSREKHLTQMRIQVSQEHKELENKKNSLLCVTCRTPVKDLKFPLSDQISLSSLLSPQLISSVKHDVRLPVAALQPEIEPSFNLWKISAEKDKEFLQEENVFLEALKNSPYSSQDIV